MIKKILKSQAGISIVQTLIAAGLMGGLALVMGKLGQNQGKMQQATMISSDLTAFQNNLQKVMLSDAACFQSLSKIDSLGINETKDIPAIVAKDGTTVILSKTKSPSPKLDVVSLQAKRVSESTIEIIYKLSKKNKKNSMGAQDFERKFVIDAQFNDATGKITKCFSHMSNAEVTARELACKDLCDTCWNDTLKHCDLSLEFKKDLVREALADLNPVPVYEERNIVNTKTCSKCDKSGCNPCPSGWVESGRSCSTGKLCGFKPRWRNCKSTCTLVRDGKRLTTIQPTVISEASSTVRTCSKCDKNGCNPCKAGETMTGRSCNKGKTCGFKPRWRNCSATCKTYNYNGGAPAGYVIKL